MIKTFIVDNHDYFGIKVGNTISSFKSTEIPIADRYKTGSTISKGDIDDVFISKSLEEEVLNVNTESEEEVEVLENDKEDIKPHQVSLLEIDDRLREIDDFLK